eukprot:3617091-Pyramimonas_sp.AAC.1
MRIVPRTVRTRIRRQRKHERKGSRTRVDVKGVHMDAKGVEHEPLTRPDVVRARAPHETGC